jgi:hypothetical protein
VPVQTPLKQIEGIFAGYTQVTNFSANGSSSNITTAITTALSTAGRGGVSLPLQVSANENQMGVVTAAPSNRVELRGSTSKDKLQDANQNEIFGRVTEATGVYTLSYFVINDAGAEAAATFSTATAIDFEFVYRFDFKRLPADFAVSLVTRNVSQDVPPGAVIGKGFAELLTVTATNTVSALSKTPDLTANVQLVVNGQSVDNFGGANAPFSVSGKNITWNAVNAGYILETTDRVIARYTTLE